jgi:hypothetical protein
MEFLTLINFENVFMFFFVFSLIFGFFWGIHKLDKADKEHNERFWREYNEMREAEYEAREYRDNLNRAT